MKTTKIVAIAATVLMTFSTLALLAQGPPPPSGPGSGAPIDGGAIMLVIGAAAAGYRKMKEGREKKSE